MARSKTRIIRYEIPGGWTVLVGGADTDNDYLSTVVATPQDYWFHANGVPGSHVILRARLDADPDRDTLRRAAAIAAFHSKARSAARVAVHCARARQVRKPRGAKAGTVHLTGGTVVKVRPDIGFATRLPPGELSAESVTAAESPEVKRN